MSIKRRLLASATLGASLALAVVAAPATAFASSPSSGAAPTLPQVSSATAGSTWLASQFNSSGFIPVSGEPTQPDLSSTANSVLALASTGADTTANEALSYLSTQVNNYVTVDGSDGPGQLALLILDAHALGANPRSFGGTNLVSRLLATERSSGLFGVQDAKYDGAYREGLALSALAAVGDTSGSKVQLAISWLKGQQCPDGGWTSLITTDNPCNGDPADFEGPDTNSTSQAIQGLSAQGALAGKPAMRADKFIRSAQDSDAGWGFEPNAADAPGSSDPDSTALVIQAVLALGKSPSVPTFVKGGANPVSELNSFQLTSGAGSGAFQFPGSSDPDLLATYQAVPALSGVTFPFNLAVSTPSLPNGTVGKAYSATLAAEGGSAPYKWQLVSGAGTLPVGLRLKANGTISGKPTTAGPSTFSVEVLAAKSASSPATQAISWRTLSITIKPTS
jgi:hypothetical protein